MYAIRSYYEYPGLYMSTLRASGTQPEVDPELEQEEARSVKVGMAVMTSFGLEGRITSYNVCYTKLLRKTTVSVTNLVGEFFTPIYRVLTNMETSISGGFTTQTLKTHRLCYSHKPQTYLGR